MIRVPQHVTSTAMQVRNKASNLRLRHTEHRQRPADVSGLVETMFLLKYGLPGVRIAAVPLAYHNSG